MRLIQFLIVVFFFFGCTKNDDSISGDREQDPNAEVADNVVVISNNNSNIISTENEIANGIYKIQFTQSLPKIEIQDLIIGDEGYGFLRKVESIEAVDNIILMNTSPATMEEVFGNISIDFSTDLSSLNRIRSPQITERMNYEYFADGVSRNENSFIFDFANVVINSDASANLMITEGSLTFDPNFIFDIDYSLFSLNKFQFGTQDAELLTTATFQLNANGNTTLPVTESILYENSKTFIKLVGNIPVVVTVFLKLKSKSEVALNGNLEITKKLEHQSNFSLGATYQNRTWTTLAELNTNFTNHPINLNNSYVNVTNKLSIVPEVVIAFYGINGPLIEPTLSGNFGIDVDTNSDWDASLDASVQLNFGASLGVLGNNLISLPFDTYDIYTQTIWKAPSKIEIISGNNQTANEGQELNEPIVVRVLDNSGLVALENVQVYFNVTSGGGTISSQIVATDENGMSQINWSLGNNQNPQTVEVKIKNGNGEIINDATVAFAAATNEVDNCDSPCGELEDFDNNTYQTVMIDGKCWMQSNLNVSHYRNGDEIPQVSNITEFNTMTTGAWCYYSNNASNGAIYGKLYNWYAVVDPRGLAPEGWHIPSQNEIDNLVETLGGRNVAGGKLKSVEGWNAPNTGATNSTCFTALPTGVLGGYGGGFEQKGEVCSWWTTESNNNFGCGWSTYYFSTEVLLGCQPKGSGFSVRCIKD